MPPISMARDSQKMRYSQIVFPCLFTATSTALLGFTAWAAQATFAIEPIATANHARNWINQFDANHTLTILRVLQGLLSTCTSISLFQAFELLQWVFTANNDGVRIFTLLGLSPTTGVVGALKILLTKKPWIVDRGWTGLRLLLMTLIWLSGVLLFVDTSLATTYHPVYTYTVTAGVGQFDGSYVIPYIQKLQSIEPDYKLEIMPYSSLALAYNLVVNPTHSLAYTPIVCTGLGCDSYLFTGGLIMTTPWPASGYTSSPVVQIINVPASQIEFQRSIAKGDTLLDEDCMVFSDGGKTLIAIRFCVGASRVSPGSLIAGVFVCPDYHCNSTGSLPNVTATFAIYNRKATVVASRSNFSIISTSDVGIHSLDNDIDVAGFKNAISWLLNFSAAGIPATSSIAESFWSGQTQLSNEYWSPELYHTFQSILAFPIWWFNPNNFGNTNLSAQTIDNYLPAEFRTKASIATPFTKIVVNRAMFVVFITLESTILAFVWGTLIWMCISRPILPELTSYPLVNFALKAKYNFGVRAFATDEAVSQEVFRAGDMDVLERLSMGEKVVCATDIAFKTATSIEMDKDKPAGRHGLCSPIAAPETHSQSIRDYSAPMTTESTGSDSQGLPPEGTYIDSTPEPQIPEQPNILSEQNPKTTQVATELSPEAEGADLSRPKQRSLDRNESRVKCKIEETS